MFVKWLFIVNINQKTRGRFVRVVDGYPTIWHANYIKFFLLVGKHTLVMLCPRAGAREHACSRVNVGPSFFRGIVFAVIDMTTGARPIPARSKHEAVYIYA